MKIKQYIWIFLVVLGFVSCSSSTTTPTATNIAQVNAFYLASNDTFPGFAEATYTVVQGNEGDTGSIYVDDSIRYGTPIERAVPRYVFEATPGYATMHMGDTSIALTGSDTINLNLKPMYLTIYSSDLTVKKTYSISTYIHQVDPDLYQWQCLTDYLYLPRDESELQLVTLGDVFYIFSNNGYGNRLFRSTDATNWTELPLTDLPDYCQVKGIISDGQKLYYAKDSLLYTSTDASTWTVQNYSKASFRMEIMLMYYNDLVWAVLEDKETHSLTLGMMVDGEMTDAGYHLDDRFPISGFCAVEFASSSYRRRAMIIGGYTREGECINSRWNIEYTPNGEQRYRVINYSIEQPNFTTLTGVSVVWYDNKLLMFGGVDADMVYRGDEVLYSKDEGFNWLPMDSSKCELPISYTARQKQSVIVHNNNIYVAGGQDASYTYTEVYMGRLNSIDWEK